MKPPNIDMLRKACERFQRECFIASGIAAFGTIYLFSFNRNILYLGLLAATYIVSSAFFTSPRIMLVVLASFAFLAASPAGIPKATFIKPSKGYRFIKGNYYEQPGPGGTWQYKFQVSRLEQYQLECGGALQGSLIIDGRDLDGFVIDFGSGGYSIKDGILVDKGLNAQHLSIPLEKDISGEFVVSLRRKTDAPARIFIGAETDGSDIYSDAVWLEFKNERCSVLYHAKRQVVPAQ
jgi:hypothetical protein